ncbi:MAG: hypothetical protein ACYDA1_08670 [Vulcanimicrobiaceae bacterium]
MPKRPRLRYWMGRLLSSILLGTACVAFPVPGHANLCDPRLGCRQIEPPRLSMALASHIVERYLAQNPPVVRLLLRQPIGAYVPAKYMDLVRAGLLRIIQGKPGQEPGPSYDLTEKGKREIAAGFFLVKQERFISSSFPDFIGNVGDFIEIPVGRYRFVGGSAVLTPKALRDPDAVRLGFPEITFKYYFDGNANADELLRLGPAGDWLIAVHSALHTTLHGVGRVAKRSLMLRPCHGMWMVRDWLLFGSACP